MGKDLLPRSPPPEKYVAEVKKKDHISTGAEQQHASGIHNQQDHDESAAYEVPHLQNAIIGGNDVYNLDTREIVE